MQLLERKSTGSSSSQPSEVDVPATRNPADYFALPSAASGLSGKIEYWTPQTSAIDPSQAWFWTPAWQAAEAIVTAELAAGLGEVFEDVEDFLADLDQ